MNKVLPIMLAFLVISIPVLAKGKPVKPPKSEVRVFEATFCSEDITSGSVEFEAVDDGWDNLNKKWFRYIDSSEAYFIIENAGEYSFEGTADMSFVAKVSLKGRDILWAVRIRTATYEYLVGQKESEGLVTSYDKSNDLWRIAFNDAKCTVYETVTSTRVGECGLTFVMIIERLPR